MAFEAIKEKNEILGIN